MRLLRSRPERSISRRWALIVLALVAACAPPSAEDVAGSVTRVEARPCGGNSAGSGSVVGEELVLTNAHIVAGSNDDVAVRTPDHRLLPARVVGFDPQRDLALLLVAGLGLQPVALGSPEIGSVSILARPTPDDYRALEATVVRTFNATGDDIYGEGDVARRALELSVDVMPGASGAGVFSRNGELVGVVFAESRGRDSITYAVAAEEIRSFLDETDTGVAADTLRCR